MIYSTTILRRFTMVIAVLFSILTFSQVAQADTATYTEDFSTNDYFNSSTSSELTKWLGGSQLMWNMNEQPAPYAFASSTSVGRIARNGQYIYTTSLSASGGGTMQVFNIGSLSYTTIDMASWAITSQINEMEVSGNYLYITWGKNTSSNGGLAVVDISTPTAPALVRNLTGIPGANYITVSGNYAYVVANFPGNTLTVVDISNPINVSVVSSVNLTNNLDHFDLVKWNDYIIIGRTGTTTGIPFAVYDVSTPTAISAVTVTYSSAAAYDLNKPFDTVISGNTIFSVGQNDSGAGDTYTYALTSGIGSIKFTQLATDEPANSAVPQLITSDGTYYYINGYILSSLSRDYIVYEVDLASSGSITERGNVQYNSPYGLDITVYDSNLWAASPQFSLLQFDVSDPDDPGPGVSTVTGASGFLDVADYGSDELATAGGSAQDILAIVNADTPTNLLGGSSVATSVGCAPSRLRTADSAFVAETFYIACENYYGYTNDPEHGATTWTNTSDTVNDVLRYNDVVYVLNQTNGLTTWNASANTLLDTDAITSGPDSMVTYGEYLIVVNGSSQIRVYDISTATNPELVTAYTLTGGSAFDIDVSGNQLYTVGSKLNVINADELVANVATPTNYASNDLGPIYKRIIMAGGYAHIGLNTSASGGQEYEIWNVKDPTAMVQVTDDDVAGTDLAGGFAVRDSWLFVADGSTNGLQAVHHMYPRYGFVNSTVVDTAPADTTITDISFTMTAELNGGSIQYVFSNDNGATWSSSFTATSTTLTNTYTFSSTGSQLLWRANLWADDTINAESGSYQTTPVMTNVSIAYTYESVTVAPPSSITVSAFPDSGSYTGPQSIELTSNTAPITIYYTTDGSTPTTASTVYDPQNPIEVTTTSTVKALAVDASGNASAVGSFAYTIAPDDDKNEPTSFAVPTADDANPAAAPFNVMLLCEDAVDQNPQIRYTTDGTLPIQSSAMYLTPISITGDTELRFRCFDASGNSEITINTENYVFADTLTIDTTAPMTIANPSSGTYPSAISVSLETSDDFDPNPTIFYTIDGSTPTTASSKYEVPLTFNTDTTFQFFAVDASGNTETVNTIEYIIGTDDAELSDPPGPGEDPTLDPGFVVDTTAPSLQAVPPGDTYSTPQTVKLVCVDDLDPNPTRYYTTTSTVVSSLIYTTPFQITTDTTLRAVCVDASGNSTDTIAEEYVITNTATDITAPTTSASCPNSFDEGELSFSVTDDYDLNPATYFTVDGSTATRLAAFVYSSTFRTTTTYSVNYFSRDASGNEEEAKTKTCKVYDSSKLNIKTKDKKKKTGTVRIVNKKTKKVIKKFKAFNKRGVKSAIVKVNGEKRVIAINYQSGRQMKLFDLNGNRLSSKRISKKNVKQEIGAGNANGKKKQGEIIVANISGTDLPIFSATAYVVNKKTNKLKSKATYTTTDNLGSLPTKGFTVTVNKKKKILIKPRKGNTTPVMIFKLTKKKGKFSFNRIK